MSHFSRFFISHRVREIQLHAVAALTPIGLWDIRVEVGTIGTFLVPFHAENVPNAIFAHNAEWRMAVSSRAGLTASAFIVIAAATFDLSVKNPNGSEQVKHRTPREIMDEIAALDAESASVLGL